jgi:hypothetical protein
MRVRGLSRGSEREGGARDGRRCKTGDMTICRRSDNRVMGRWGSLGQLHRIYRARTTASRELHIAPAACDNRTALGLPVRSRDSVRDLLSKRDAAVHDAWE